MATRSGSSGRRKKTTTAGRKTNSKRRTSAGKRSRSRADFNENGLQDEIVILVFVAAAIMLFLSNLRIMGAIGDKVSSIQFGLFGLMAYVFPIILAAFVIALYFFIGNPNGPFKMFVSFVLFLDLCSMSHMFVLEDQLASKDNAFVFCSEKLNGGGIVGGFFSKLLYDALSKAGSWIVLVVLFIVCLMLLTGISLFDLLDSAGHLLDESADRARTRSDEWYEKNLRRREEELERRDQRNKRRAELDKRRAAVEEKEEKQLRRDKKQDGFDLANSSIPKRSASADTSELMYIDEETGEAFFDEEEDYSATAVPQEPSLMDDVVVGAFKGIFSRSKADDHPTDEEMKEAFDAEMERRSSKASEIDYSESEEGEAFDNTEVEESFDYVDDSSVDYEEQDSYDEFDSGEAVQPSLSVTDLSDEEFDVSSFLNRIESQRGSSPAPVYVHRAGTESPKAESSEESLLTDVTNDEQIYEDSVYEDSAYEEASEDESFDEEPVGEESFDEELFDEEPFVDDAEIPAADEVIPPVETASESIFKASQSGGQARSDSSGAQFSKPSAKKEEKLPGLPFILKKGWRLPKREDYPRLFDFPDNKGKADTMSEINEMKEKIKDVLDSFGVSIEDNIEATKGPAVTRFEIAPVRGVKVSKILNLEHDIMLGLAAESLRIEAPIPGVSRVGLEIPNRTKDSVAFCELLTSREYREFPGKLAFAVGRGMSGENVVHDIAKMPHVLVAGATGSGKSVCINTIIISLLMKYTPQQLRLYMVDPKVVELSVYNDIPHLYGQNVVTDPKQATAMLQSVVAEMDDRYVKFATAKVRDIKGYNEKALQNAGVKSINEYYYKVRKGEISEYDLSKPLPHIVVIIDELADLMMTAGKEVEASIVRIAQLARACGIHLVIATQRPSVDVVTGLIKANMPSRIAFAVSSGTDSRTIIDAYGAEKLLGMGDMLFYPAGKNHPERVQGAYVSDDEVQNVIDFWVNQMNENEKGELTELQTMDKANAESGQGRDSAAGGAVSNSESGDEYLAEAARFIVQSNKASIGMLQRKFKIGFNRAARIMDTLHDLGVVGDEEGTKSRKILIDMSQLENMLEAGEL